MSSVIKLTNLTKTYGKARGINKVNLDVPEGTIFGFLGPNGAGKSTTINMLIGLIRPTSGKIELFGKELKLGAIDSLKDIGFLASDMALDGHLTGWQQLEYFGHIRGNYDKKHIHELAKRLDCNLNRKIKTLSRGNRQKVGLIAALMHKPKLLILDEPTSGLDPLMQAEFNKIIQEHKRAGNTTFISSHILSEVQEICDRVAFIREGEVVANTTVAELAKAAPKQVKIVSADAKLPESIKKLKGLSNPVVKKHVLQFDYTGDISALVGTLSRHNLSDLSIENTDLESTFMTFYEDDNA